MLCDLPKKLFTTMGFDLALYFMTNLRRTPGHFFVFLLFTFACTLTMSMYFRFIAAVSKTLAQAMAPASVFSLALVIYTGFAMPTGYMRPWFRWLNYFNPVAYAFESLMINEFHDRQIPCSRYVPEGDGYESASPGEHICATTGAAAGADFIDGDVYLAVNFDYHSSHLWRNLGIMVTLMIFGCFIYLLVSAYILEQKSKGEEKGPAVPPNLQQQTAVIHWEDVNFDVNIKKTTKRILNNVNGWVRPGAGKTTLRDVLASRTTVGVVSGNIYIDGRLRNSGFQRKTGYAQQQDIHLPTSTVREALTFSAVLRQPRSVPDAEKIAYVDEVIKILEMDAYAEAIVGVPGEGLNVEQRKRLTIGVELAARPALLLFFDEPTSGSQTAWSICTLLRKLADNGQAVLCTLHQPSASLFQMFDRLLYLAMEGKSVYFGELGSSSRIVIDYFESKGARPIRRDENPAEWILEVTGTAPSQKEGSESWPELWNGSDELREVKAELTRMKDELSQKPELIADADALRLFAEDNRTQLWWVVRRNFQQYWRTPSYVIPKIALCLFSVSLPHSPSKSEFTLHQALFIGFSFWKTPNTFQGLQNQLFAVFLLITIFGNFCSQMMPHIVRRRELFEARERQAKTYSWQIFVLSDILVGIPWNSLAAVLVFVCWYYPINLQQNAISAGQTAERGGLMFLFILAFMNFAGTFTSMALSLVGTAEAAGNIVTLLFSLSLIFCGVLATPTALPGVWIFMYRVSPLTYLVSGMLSTGLANARITCATEELLRFAPPAGSNCTTYLTGYQKSHGGYLTPESAGSTRECVFCTGNDTNVYLNSVSVEYSDRWRNFGIFWVYVVFNTVAAIGFYWLARVPKGKKKV
nr:zeb2-regulated abc transporter 1 [Quercus suber]